MSKADHARRPERRLTIALAASGGGHVRQLLDLEPVWSQHDYFFITEDTALGQTLRETHRTYFVPHFAWGQAKLGGPWLMLKGALGSFFRSAAVMLKERPDLIISSGAGAVFFAVVWARLAGARVVVMESFARFDSPSLFGRLAAPLAHDMIIQSSKLTGRYPRARVFDPFRVVPGSPPAKQPLLFATVGATLPFDRLVDSVAALAAAGRIPEKIIVQTGVGGHAPETLETHETLPFDEVQTIQREASIVVCHGGTGSLITALRQGCRVVAMPRLAKRGEHYDDHQTEIVEAFAQRGLIQVANSTEELAEALEAARRQAPVMATTDPQALIAFLRELIDRLPRSSR